MTKVTEKEIIAVAKRFLTFGPDYAPLIKNGWVRKFKANQKRLQKVLRKGDDA